MEARREAFVRYLTEKHPEKYAAALGAGTRTGPTAVFRALGLCPADRCILTLTDDQARALAQWWQGPKNRKGAGLSSLYRSAMGHWLDFMHLDRRPEPEQRPAAPLRVAPEGFTPACLLEQLVREGRML